MTAAQLDSILERLSQVLNDVDEVHGYALHGKLALPYSTVKAYLDEASAQATDILRLVS
jgi:hypothetical protein